jgi:predicted RNase H-like HicB family nuclease
MEIKEAYQTRIGSLGLEIYVKDPTIGGYTAYFADFPAIITEGDNVEKAQQNLWNVVHDFLKYYIENDI